MRSAHREVLLCTIPREASSPSCAPGSSFTALVVEALYYLLVGNFDLN